MNKRIYALLCALLAISLMLTACGGGGSSSDPDGSEDLLPSADSSKTTISSSADGGDTTAHSGGEATTTADDGSGATTGAGGGDATKAPSGSGTDTKKPTVTQGTGKTTTTTTKKVESTATTTSGNGGDGMLNVKDGPLYQPANGKYNNYIKYRNTLANTYSKLTTGNKKLKVVYFGGSVTVGYGASNQDTKSWRALIGQWLVDTFPNAEVTNLNRGTGESGTYLGSYRFERDVVAADPDLVFIEYSINDLYADATYAQAASQYEAIVRGIRQKLPDCDIVTVLVTDQGRANGRLHTQAQAHEDVSIAYGIPTIHVGRALADYLIEYCETDVWSNYMIDIVHPNDKGYNFYYEVVREFMTTCLKDYKHDGKVKNYTTPAQQCNVLHNGSVTVIEPTAAVISRSEALGGSGFRVVNQPYGIDNYNSYFLSDDKNTEIVIEFTGTELVMLKFSSGIEKFKIKIDNGSYTTKTLTSINNLALNPTVLVTDLPSGKHTIYLKPENPSGRGSIKIGAFFSRDEAKASRK